MVGSLSREVFLQRDHGVVVRLHRVNVIRHYRFDGARVDPVGHQRHDVLDSHLVFRDGSRLVNAKRVDTGKSFYTVHLMHKGLFLRETDYAREKRKACEKVEPLGNHSDERPDCGDYALAVILTKPRYLLDKHYRADRNEKNSDPLDKPCKREHHFAFAALFALLRFTRQAGGKAVLADCGQPRKTAPAHYKASGDELVSRLFAYLIGFARYKRLVCDTFAFHNDCIGVDLRACRENGNVVPHGFVGVELYFLPVADHDAFLRRQKSHLVESFLRFQLLKNSDQRVCDDYSHERQIAP